MYESPIDIICSDVQMKLEGEVYKAVQNVGINVDKDELIKALSYDRQQYDKGYADAKAEQQWIPVKMRPMDSEEREYWEEHAGFTLTDDMAQTFDCPMPADGQRIWVQTKNGLVFDDVCDSDCDGIGLEGNGDWDDIVAWMPMFIPEPYSATQTTDPEKSS